MSEEIFKELREMRGEATERHLDTVQRLTSIETKVEDHKSDIDRHEERISSLEKYKWQLAGGVMVLAWIAEKFFHSFQ